MTFKIRDSFSLISLFDKEVATFNECAYWSRMTIFYQFLELIKNTHFNKSGACLVVSTPCCELIYYALTSYSSILNPIYH